MHLAPTQVFKRHGAVSIDTPVFELKETLTGGPRGALLCCVCPGQSSICA